MASVALFGRSALTYHDSYFPNPLYFIGNLLTSPTQLFYRATHSDVAVKKTFQAEGWGPLIVKIIFKVIYVITGLFVFDLLGIAFTGLGLIGEGARKNTKKNIENDVNNYKNLTQAIEAKNKYQEFFREISEYTEEALGEVNNTTGYVLMIDLLQVFMNNVSEHYSSVVKKINTLHNGNIISEKIKPITTWSRDIFDKEEFNAERSKIALKMVVGEITERFSLYESNCDVFYWRAKFAY